MEDSPLREGAAARSGVRPPRGGGTIYTFGTEISGGCMSRGHPAWSLRVTRAALKEDQTGGRGPDAWRTIDFKETDTDRTRAEPLLPQRTGQTLLLRRKKGMKHIEVVLGGGGCVSHFFVTTARFSSGTLACAMRTAARARAPGAQMVRMGSGASFTTSVPRRQLGSS
eukprot:gene10695-biopygen15357